MNSLHNKFLVRTSSAIALFFLSLFFLVSQNVSVKGAQLAQLNSIHIIHYSDTKNIEEITCEDCKSILISAEQGVKVNLSFSSPCLADISPLYALPMEGISIPYGNND